MHIKINFYLCTWDNRDSTVFSKTNFIVDEIIIDSNSQFIFLHHNLQVYPRFVVGWN